jgi:predicted RNase H-like HicB family nuclease
MRNFTAIIEKCPETGLFVGYIPGVAGAHSQGETLDELMANLKEVLELLRETKSLKSSTEFIGLQTISLRVA